MSILSKVQQYGESSVGGRQVSLHPKSTWQLQCCAAVLGVVLLLVVLSVELITLGAGLYENAPLLLGPVLVFPPSICASEVPGRQAAHLCCSLREFIFMDPSGYCGDAVHKYTCKKKILVRQPGHP